MSEQAQEQDLTPTMQEMMAQMIQMRAELDSLKGRTNALAQVQVQPASPTSPQVSTTRRKVLRLLAGGLVAGLAVGGIGAALPGAAEAKLSANPTGNGLNTRVGMLVMPPGGSVGNTTMGGSPNKVGLLVSGDTSFSLADIAPTVNSAIIASTSGGGSTIVSLAQTGVALYAQSTDNYAVRGVSTSSNGVYGKSSSGIGVVGESTNGNSYGVYGSGVSGVYGIGIGGLSTGIHGEGAVNGYAGFFAGQVLATGAIYGASKQFKIDHPLDPANKYLYHTSIESPDMMNIYNGIVTLDGQGEATVKMPEWFEALNSDFRYQLTSIGVSMPNLFIAEEIQERKFKIAGGLPGQRVSWMVTGIRQDAYAKAHRSPVEEDKTGKEKGLYQHPEVFGKSKELSVNTLMRGL